LGELGQGGLSADRGAGGVTAVGPRERRRDHYRNVGSHDVAVECSHAGYGGVAGAPGRLGCQLDQDPHEPHPTQGFRKF
jgi:hypothetical protein